MPETFPVTLSSRDAARVTPSRSVRGSRICGYLSPCVLILLLLTTAGCATPSGASGIEEPEEPVREDSRDVAAIPSPANSPATAPTDTILPSLTPLPNETETPTETATPSPTATSTIIPTPTATHTPDPDAELEYVVVEGDTPGAIAASFGIDVEELMAYNGIEDPRLMQLGANLRIPVGERRVEVMRATATAVAEATVAAVDFETAVIESLPERVVIEMSHTYQKPNNCAPASTSMVLSAFGIQKDQFAVAAIQKPVASDVNVTAEEVAASIRTMGLQAYVGYNGDILLLERFLAAGLPVLTEEWMPYDGGMGHFRAIRGYDRTKQQILHNDSYYGPNLWRSHEEVLRDWRPYNYKYVIAYRPEQEELVKRIVGPNWDPTVMYQNLRQASAERVAANPNDGYAWWGLGEALLRLGNPQEAATAFENALNSGTLPWRYLWYHYGYLEALNQLGRYEDTLVWSERVLGQMVRSEDVRYHRAVALRALGRNDEAIAQLQRALEENPRFAPAQSLLSDIGG